MKILIVEDEHKIANSIKKGLIQENFIVDVAYDGEAGYDLASAEKYDAIVLDLMLPKLNGTELSSRLRKEDNHTPILMLTAKGELKDKIDGFENGADDYLVKPFAFEELLARVRALARRSVPLSSEELKIKDLTLNSRTFEVKMGKRAIELSRKEFSILEYLMRNSGRVVSKESIISNVWDYDSNILPNTVEVFIGYLRGKIGQDLIKTVRGFGYTMNNV